MLALAEAAGSPGDQERALQFSQHALAAAKKAKISDSRAFLNNAELNAEAGNYREACNLAHGENIATKDALKILAVVLREYTKKHRL